MRALLIATLAAAMAAAVTAPLAAQQAAPPDGGDYDQSAVVTLDGTADTVEWSNIGGKLFLKPTAGPMWDVTLPSIDILLKKGVSANTLTRGAPVKVRAYKAKDAACNPDCKAQGIELTVNGGQAVDLLSPVAADRTPAPAAGGRGGG